MTDLAIATVPDERQRYIDGLLMLADVLKNHPEIRLPTGRTVFHFLGDDREADREAMAAAARAIPCQWEKRFYGSEETAYFDLTGHLGALKVELAAYRDTVCVRRVVGTEDREVDEIVTPAVTKKVTKPVEIIEYDCGSLLAPRPAGLAGEASKAAA